VYNYDVGKEALPSPTPLLGWFCTRVWLHWLKMQKKWSRRLQTTIEVQRTHTNPYYYYYYYYYSCVISSNVLNIS